MEKYEIFNKRSNEVVDGTAKSPNPEYLNEGEIAINYSKEDPAIFIKNDSGETESFRAASKKRHNCPYF